VATKAVLLNVGAFLADNGLRRSIGAYSYNYTSPTANIVTNSFSLLPSQTITWNTPMTSSAVTMVSSNGGINVDFTLRPLGSYSLSGVRLHVVDSDVGQMILTNPSASVGVNVTIIQS
jgi:hypothetical protein